MREQGSNVMAVFEERLANVHLIKAYGTEARETNSVDTGELEVLLRDAQIRRLLCSRWCWS